MRPTIVACVFVVFVQNVHGGRIMEEIKSVLQASSKVNYCSIGGDIELFACKDAYGTPMELVEPERMSINTVCSMYQDGKTKSITCLSNGFITNYQSPYVSHPRIQKREWFKDDDDREWWEEEETVVLCLPCSIVGFIFCLFFCGEKPNEPPSIQCASLTTASPVYAGKGDITAKVIWTPATAYDPEDGDIEVKSVPSEFKSGMSYKKGYYGMAFYAQDSAGRGAQCSLRFEVDIKTCSHHGWPNHGTLNCTDYFTAYGRGCTVSCDPGYELNSPDRGKIECMENKQWDKAVPDCQPIPCKEVLGVADVMLSCPNGSVYSELCGVVCDDGYSVEGDYFVECDLEGNWQSDIPECKDKKPPKFTFCPPNIQVDIDRADNTAYVEWERATGTDNSNNFTIEEVNGKEIGRFTAGYHLIQYNIVDDNGNIGLSCVFTIEVQTISCDPPNLNVSGSEHMMYDCPNVYRFGAECSLACKSRYSLVGVTSIQCLNEGDSDPPVLKWTWYSEDLPPYCKETACSDLSPPDNGALACDQWAFGNTCQIQCEDGYDVARLPRGGGLYVCSTTDGNWIPDAKIPNCLERDPAENLKMGADFYYYTGECNSSAENIQEIQENFIRALNSSAYKAFCVGNKFCQFRFVDVTCGAITRRRRRDDESSSERHRRSQELAYIIEFEILIESGNSTITENENILENIFDTISEESDAGHFDIDGLEVRNGSLDVGYPELDCPEGTEARPETLSCAGCGAGRYYNKSTNDCEYCPIGTYRDPTSKTTCVQCLEKTTTLDVGADKCIPFCEPGHYSPTGLSPCGKCSSKSYQPNYKQTSCILCGTMLRTPAMGVSDIDQCTAYDIKVKRGKPISFKDMIPSSTSLTLVTWVLLQSENGNNTIVSISSADDAVSWSIKSTSEITVSKNGTDEETGIVISKQMWTHLAVTVDSDTGKIDVYINGNAEYNSTSFNIDRPVVIHTDTIIIDADMILSSFQMFPSVLGETKILELASTCNATARGSVLNSDNLAKSKNAKIVLPSKCDDTDDCDSSPCGSHGDCSNHQGGFNCSCVDGYSGTTCTDPPDFCASNLCVNGATCLVQNTTYICQCPYGYRGEHCEIKAVDGKWSKWTDWSSCPEYCGEASQRERSRACDSPPPDTEGLSCVGDRNETEQCEIWPCPECLTLRRSEGVARIDCKESDVLTRCTVVCDSGKFLPSNSPPYYDCGSVTDYIWSHQNDENPKGRLPACTEATTPNELGLTISSTYDGLTCEEDTSDTVENILTENLSSLPCISTSSCTANVTSNCKSDSRINQSADKVVTVTLNSEKLPSHVDFQELFNNQTVSAELLELLNTITALEESALIINNISSGFFNVTVNDTDYTVADVNVTADVTCEAGSIRLDSLCVKSPVGSYSDGSALIMCEKGTYQDETGSTSCKECPAGLTTDEPGAIDITECILQPIVTTESTTRKTTKKPEEIASVIICPPTTTTTTKTTTNPDHNNISSERDTDNETIIIAVTVSVGSVIVVAACGLVLYKIRHMRTKQDDENLHALRKRKEQINIDRYVGTVIAEPASGMENKHDCQW